MANLPKSPFVDPMGAGPSSSAVFGETSLQSPDFHEASVDQLIMLLSKPQYRENALSLLTKKRETSRDLGLTLWNSFNTIYILLKEVTETYKLLTPSKLTTQCSNRVCNALALLQPVASHPNTKMSFIKAHIPVYLYPFLNTTETENPFEFLRLTSLGVIGALVKVDDPQVVHFLLETEIFPLCLRCMECGAALSKTVATFIVSKILMQEEGLSYCCSFAERFFEVVRILGVMIENLAQKTPLQLLKQIIRCYLSLSELPRACCALKHRFPARLGDDNIINIIKEDPTTMRWLQQLFYNVTNGQLSSSSRLEQIGDAYGRFS